MKKYTFSLPEVLNVSEELHSNIYSWVETQVFPVYAFIHPCDDPLSSEDSSYSEDGLGMKKECF